MQRVFTHSKLNKLEEENEIGKLPESWKITSLGMKCKICYGLGQPPQKDDNGIPMIRATDIKNGRIITDTVLRVKCESIPENRAHFLQKGDIIVVRSGAYAGDVAMYDGQWDMAIAGYDLVVSPTDDTANPQFITYYLLGEANQRYFRSQRDRSAQPHINADQLSNARIPFPPPYEQRTIAYVLQTVQSTIQARYQELTLERERKAALMQHLFTQGTRGGETKQTKIGEMPESWEIVKFAEAVSITNGQVSPTEEPYRTMKHVGPENIEQNTGMLLKTKTNEQLNIISGNYYFTTQDVLYSKIRPYLNKVVLPSFEGTCSADMYPLRSKEDCFTREFLYHLMLSERVKDQIIAFQNRTGIPKINREQLGSISLPKPSLSEQQEIASVLNACNTKITSLGNEVLLFEEFFHALLEELMTGRLSTLPLVEEEGK